MRGTLKLADGTVLECDRCGTSYDQPDYLWVEIAGSLAELFPEVSDAAKTALMVYRYVDYRDTFAGYTELNLIQQQGDRCLICLRKRGNGE